MKQKTKFIVIATFFVLLAIVGFIANKLEAIEVGGSCANSSQRDSCTGPGAACLSADSGNYCSISCNADGECPSGWSCGEIASETYSIKTGEKTKVETIKMCVKP